MPARDRASGTASTPPPSRIPEFRSIDDEAEFWDTHSFTEFGDELEDVTGQVTFIVRGEKDRIVIPLDPETFAALEKRAQVENVDPTALVRRWVQERLRAS
jgi:hypothetical protein